MAQSHNIFLDVYWRSLTKGEQEVAALLAVPAWFSEHLAENLAREFNKHDAGIFHKITREVNFVFKYEKKGWYFESGLREYLLDKAEGLYKDRLEDIHTFLEGYYRQPTGEESPPGKRELTYLSLYHRLRLEPLEAGRAVLRILDESEEKYLMPVLQSLVHIYRLPPKPTGNDSICLFFELYIAGLEKISAGRKKKDKEKIRILKDIYKKVENIEQSLDPGKDRLFLKHIYRFLILLSRLVHQQNAPKAIKKLQKKLGRITEEEAIPGEA